MLLGNNQQNRQHVEHNLPSLFIGDLAKTVYDTDLYKFFKSHSFNIKSAKAAISKETNEHLGHGYVTFFNKEEAERAKNELDHEKISGNIIRLMWPNKDFKSDANIFVKNLAEDVEQKDLAEHFGK